MAADICCPECGESEELQGAPTESGLINISCQACYTVWQRDPQVRCPRCQSTDMYAAPVAVIEKSRGTQLSIVSTTSEYFCWTCDRDLIDEQRRSGTALMPDQLPTLDTQPAAEEQQEPANKPHGSRDGTT